jgi:hypothetical protein
MAHRKTAHQKSVESGFLSMVPKNSLLCSLIIKLWAVWTTFIVIILFLRVIIIAFSIDATTNFAPFILETSNKLLFLFRNLMPYETEDFSAYLDVAAIFAVILYISIFWLIRFFVILADNHINQSDKATRSSKVSKFKMQKG